MRWNRYTLKSTVQAVDFVSGILMDIGITNIELEDNEQITEAEKQEMFVDILPELPIDDGTAYISFYVAIEDEEINSGLLNNGIQISSDEIILNEAEMLGQIHNSLDEIKSFVDIGAGTISKEVTEDVDWMNNWKKFFKPFIVEDILIKPTWETIETSEQYKMVIDIDPGTAFGTGMHETTKLCIHQLRKRLQPNTKVLDLGCGSGILSIIALKLGAESVTGTDIDPNAVVVAKENALINKIDLNDYHLYNGNVIDNKELQDEIKQEQYDVVVANILADVIILLAPIVPVLMKTGGYFITSGIINKKEKEVLCAIEAVPELIVSEITYQGDWVSITAKHI